MIGLPNDSKEKSIESARLAAQIQPDIARLYPTLVLPDTELFEMMKLGKYSSLSQKDAIEICKEMYKILTEKNINITAFRFPGPARRPDIPAGGFFLPR